jgi:hypothetical protein
MSVYAKKKDLEAWFEWSSPSISSPPCRRRTQESPLLLPFAIVPKMSALEDQNWDLENGEGKDLRKEQQNINKSAHNLSTALLRKKSDPAIVSRVRFRTLRKFLVNLQQVLLGTKLCVLIPAIPLAIIAEYQNFSRVSTKSCHL